ncbi:MAG: ATP-binding cassette domain-containing protein [Xanthomonadales bacterium]|nr:ATP-binding cassette domain-containing protein [Xanthomonadales bacterium]
MAAFEPSPASGVANVNGSSPSGPLLEVAGLSVAFEGESGWTSVVDDVSFSVGRGEILGLVGESGSGKTVTCLSITNLLPERTAQISAGRIDFDGRDLAGLTRRELEDVRRERI